VSYITRRRKSRKGVICFGKTLLFLFFVAITFGAGYFSVRPVMQLVDFITGIFIG
jgi:hypothetical protein